MLKIIRILILIRKSNDIDPKFKFGDHVRISKYKNILAKGFTLTWSEQVFVITKVKKHCFMDICF